MGARCTSGLKADEPGLLPYVTNAAFVASLRGFSRSPGEYWT
jgi:hypothetical protein